MITKIGIIFLLGIFAILSLTVAAGGHSGFTYWAGLGFFVFCVLLTFYAVAQLTGGHHKQSDHH